MRDTQTSAAAEDAERARRRRRWAARLFFLALPICAALSALAPGIVERALISGSGDGGPAPSRPLRQAPGLGSSSPRSVPFELDHRPIEVPQRFGASPQPAVAQLSDVLRSEDVLRSHNPPKRRQTPRPPTNPAKLRYAAPDRAPSAMRPAREAVAPPVDDVELELRPRALPPKGIAPPLVAQPWPDDIFGEQGSFVVRFVAPSVVPEPGSALLVASGLLLVALRTRRDRNE